MLSSEIRELMAQRQLDMFDSTPTALTLLLDPVGDGKVENLVVLYANTASKALIPAEVGELNHVQIVGGDAQFNTVQSNVDAILRGRDIGETGFIGPFAYTTTNAEGDTVHVEYRSMYLGEYSQGHLILTVTVDVTAKVFQQKMEAAGHTPQGSNLTRLTDREKSIGPLIVKGLTTKEIASDLGISHRTVENHRASIRKKMNLTDKTISISECLANF